MTKNSYLCNYIKDHPNTWKEDFAELGILYREEGSYCIFNYGFPCDFSDPRVQEARGIIIDMNTLDVVCRPFRKFGNYQESYADKMDWESAVIQEKVDGSIIKLWHDPKTQKWRFSSNSCITPDPFFTALLQECFHQIPYSSLQKENTYIFELVSPQNQIVVPYPTTELYHLGTRNNETGQEYSEKLPGMKHPHIYSIVGDLEHCIEAVRSLNAGKSSCTQEGFVVVDKDFHRVKVKSPEYIMLHHMNDNQRITYGSLSKKNCIHMIQQTPEMIESFLKNYPQATATIRFYQWKLAELEHQIDFHLQLGRQLWEEFSQDRKAVAKELQKNPYAYYCFYGIDDPNATGKEVMDHLSDATLLRQIEDYPMQIPMMIQKNWEEEQQEELEW